MIDEEEKEFNKISNDYGVSILEKWFLWFKNGTLKENLREKYPYLYIFDKKEKKRLNIKIMKWLSLSKINNKNKDNL